MEAIASGKGDGKTVWRSRVSATGKLPKFRSPQLATLVDAPPEGPEWVHELKYDGYRCLIAIGGGKIVCYTRNEQDWTEKFASLVPAAEALTVESALIDGEVVVADRTGRSDFASLQQALKDGTPLSYFAFDLIELGGEDLSRLPLLERKAKLKRLIGKGIEDTIFYSEHVRGEGPKVFKAVCAERQEGIVSKRADAPYRGARTRTWLKLKCSNSQEFVIGGWLPSNKRHGFKSLLIGYYSGDDLVYAGRVGTGFDDELLHSLGKELQAIEQPKSPFVEVPRDARRRARWVRPKLVAEIEFTEFTSDGIARHPSFLGLRKDKSAREVVKEVPRRAPK
jgi:bifunctional non-homologous end joining protein LigD